jgi:DNA-binding CsgD family transcriptional regulator
MKYALTSNSNTSDELLFEEKNKLQAIIEAMGKILYQTQKDWDDIFDTIPDMITVHDRDFNIMRANKAAQKMLDLPSPGNDAELKCFQYYHGTEAPLKGCPSCNCLTTGEPAVFEVFEPYLQMYIEIRAIPRFDNNKQLTGLIHVVRDITKRKETEISLKRSKDELRARARDLKETNQALKVLLRQRENDKAELEEKILSNIKILINPYIKELKKMKFKSNELDYVRILESNIHTMTSSFSKKLSSNNLALTYREIQIANLIREGKQSKDIAEMMNISFETTNCHRQNIRKKLGLKNANINLRAYLSSLDD